MTMYKLNFAQPEMPTTQAIWMYPLAPERLAVVSHTWEDEPDRQELNGFAWFSLNVYSWHIRHLVITV